MSDRTILQSDGKFALGAGETRDRLMPGQTLVAGTDFDSIFSPDHKHRLTLQKDGNLVLYVAGKEPVDISDTRGCATQAAIMQADGNFVLLGYRHGGKEAEALWASNTQKNPKSYIKLQEDGKLVIYKPAAETAIWFKP